MPRSRSGLSLGQGTDGSVQMDSSVLVSAEGKASRRQKCDSESKPGVNVRPRKNAQMGRDGVRRKDWHDYEAIRRDAARSGNGEQGKPFPLTDTDRVDQAYRENGFNIYVSDRISLNRSVADIRHLNCKQKLYGVKLPNTSIIIPFHNEGWSSLLRTVHSVLNRSPPELIAEVILVDDFSDKGRGSVFTLHPLPLSLLDTQFGGHLRRWKGTGTAEPELLCLCTRSCRPSVVD
ncbi:unnamed protein product, partial [Coregonus sp. 'balchen']